MITNISLADAKPKEDASFIGKVLNEAKFTNTDILKYLIGDESAIAEIMAWGKEKARMKFKRGDVIEVKNVIVSEKSPLFVFTKKTDVRVIDKHIADEKIYTSKFIDEIPEFGYVYVDGFISRTFGIFDYYCKRCRKFSEEVCSCGNFSEKIFRISGIFSDSTGDILFTTDNEEVAEKMTSENRPAKSKNENENEIIKNIMGTRHRFFGYLCDKKFIVVEVNKI